MARNHKNSKKHSVFIYNFNHGISVYINNIEKDQFQKSKFIFANFPTVIIQSYCFIDQIKNRFLHMLNNERFGRNDSCNFEKIMSSLLLKLGIEYYFYVPYDFSTVCKKQKQQFIFSLKLIFFSQQGQKCEKYYLSDK